MASNQQHWELIKMQPLDDTDTTEFGLLDLEPKTLDHLLEFGITGSVSTVSSGGEVDRTAEAGATDSGDGGTSNVLGGASPITMSYGVSGSNANVSLLSAPSSTNLYDTPMLSDQKPQIRHDCMWAGMCADQSHPEKHSGGCGGCARQQHLLQHQQQQSSLGSAIGNLAIMAAKDILKVEQSGEQPAETALTAKSGQQCKDWTALSSVLVSRATAASNTLLPVPRTKYTSSQASLLAPFKATQGADRIPAGSSLLIKRQQQLSSGMLAHNCRQLPPSPPTSSSESGASSGEGGSETGEKSFRTVRVPHLPRGSFLAAREQEARSIAAQNHARPDTPLSLDDDPLEFKHNLDLVATCTIGSNQQSLLHTTHSSLPSIFCSSSSASSPTNSTTATATTSGSVISVAKTSGAESRTFYGRLGGNCSCGGTSSSNSVSSSNSISSIGHTTQCYVNYLQDPSSADDIRIKQLREQLIMLDESCAVLSNHHNHHHHHHNFGDHYHHVRPDSPDVDRQLEQLLIDLREIDESSSCLLDDQQQHTTSSASHSVGLKDGSPLSSSSSSSSSSSLHQQQQEQHQQQQRSSLSLAPCGGELSGGAHATCSKEWYCGSLEPHHLASPSSERRRRHQFAHRRRSITGRGWMSDDDEDEEVDLLKLLEEDDDCYEKHFEQTGANVVAAGNTPTCGYTNSSSWEDDEEEDEEEDDEEEEEDEEESGEDEDDKDEQEEEVDEDEEEEEEGDANEESMYGDGSSSRSRSRVRTSHHRYHSQYNHQRRVARSYRPYDVETYNSNGKNHKKQSTNNVLSAGGVNTIIAGSGASLKSSMLSSKIGSTSCNSSSNTNGSLNNSAVASTAQQQSTGGSGANSYQATHFGDHSYTRPKGGYNMNELGVQTPSDSDEEIDVVSVGDKNLPTNPTERDMRHMQSEVANKIRTASSRSTSNGSLPYGTGSSHHHHHYQRQHHLADGQRLHQLGGIYPTPAGSTTISGANTPLPTRSGGASVVSSPPPACTTSTGLLHTSSSTSSSGTSRKRPVSGSGKRSSNASKRMRLGHTKRGGAGGDGGNGGRYDTAAQALAEELDTVEKRNLHNNLERQRRIGLKNLFEELKRQIPQLRDKDRAPKVNILREAAVLCTRLNQEAEQVNELRQQQMKLYERVRYLRASIHSQQRFGV